MKIEIKSKKDVRDFIPKDLIITLDVDGTERQVQVWNDEDSYTTDWRADDQTWYDALNEDDTEEIDGAVMDAFHAN